MKNILLLLFVSVLLSHNIYAQAQTNFVLTPQVLPQYPDKFYDYFDKSKIMLLVQSDPSNFFYKNIRLSGKFVGDNGIVVQTSEVFIPLTKIYCSQGQTVIVQGYDLRKYFEVNNIITEGISKTDLQFKPLPEGNYQFCFVAFADTAGISYQVSLDEPRGCSSQFSILNLTAAEPPQLIMPQCESKIKPVQPQNIIFNWLPVAGIISPEYTFKIVELSLNQDPNIVIDAQSGNLFFETKTYTPNYLYAPASPPLVAGKKYVWRVTVNDLNKNITVKNNGKSEVCVFEYADETVTQTTTTDFHLLSPSDKSTLLETPKGYEFKYSQTLNGNYVLYFTELMQGQSASKAMQDAIKNKTFFTQTGKELPPEYTTFFVGNFDYKFKPGKSYAWCVKSENDFTKETWAFNVPINANDTLSIGKFSVNGFSVMVTKIENPNPKFFSGSGKINLFNDPWGPQANVNFYGLSLANLEYDVKKGSVNWECVIGIIDGDILNFKPINLTDKNNAGGNFSLVKGSKIKLTASKETKYDDAKKVYIITKTNEDNKSELRAQLLWETEIVPAEGGYNVGDVSANSVLSEAMIISTYEMFVGFTPDKNFKGTMYNEKQIQFKTLYPKNFEVEIVHPQFVLDAKTVECYLTGSIKIPDGRADLAKDLKADFTAQKSFHFTVDVPEYKLELNTFSATTNKITSELSFSKVEVDLKTGGGVNLPEAFITTHFPNQNITSTFSTGYNKGEGYHIKETEKNPVYYKLNTFDAGVVNRTVNLHNSILYQLELDGIFQVPFLNQEAAFNYYVSEEGDGSGTVFFIEEPSVIYDDASTGDKLAVAPYSANLLEDRIVLDADFNFSNNKNENLNVQHVIAKQMYIKANGEIGWHKTGFFVWTNFVGVTSKYEWRAIEQQQTGNFGGFVYKVNSLGIGYSGNGQYHFATRGNIVLEEHSLSTKNFDVQISYNQNNFKNRINDKTLTASTQKYLPDGATNLITPATGIEIQPQGVKTEYHDGSMDMVVEVKYFKNDATYGNGFKTESEVTMKVPVVRAVYSKTLIGKSNGFNYWYVQGKYKDDAGIPTGILDLVAYEFDGRFYYNMNHKTEVNNLSDNSYTPDNNIGLGLFALTKIKSGASDGAVINATGAIKVETGSKAATFYCDAKMLNEDLATNTSMIDGDGVIQWNFSPLFIDGNIRVKQSLFGIFGGADVTAHLFLDPSTLSLDVAAPMHVNYINIDANVNAGIKMNTDLMCNVNAGFSAELAGIKKDVGVCTATAILTVNAAMSGEFKYGIPFNISGTGGLSAHVSCGVFDGGVGVTGAYSLPSPFCLAAGMSFSIPYPSMCCHCKWCFCPAPCIDYYNLGFGLRWKSNANPMFSFSPTCD